MQLRELDETTVKYFLLVTNLFFFDVVENFVNKDEEGKENR